MVDKSVEAKAERLWWAVNPEETTPPAKRELTEAKRLVEEIEAHIQNTRTKLAGLKRMA